MPKENIVTQDEIIKAFVEEDKTNAAFIRDLLQNAIIIPKPGKEQIIETTTSRLRAFYKTAIKTYGEDNINEAQTEDTAYFEAYKLVRDVLDYDNPAS
jgi:hypothetical protein